MSTSALIYNNLRVVNASNFINVYDATPTTTNYLYLGLSGTTAWADEVNPPAPSGALDENTSFWSELIGAHRIQVADLVHVVPRVNFLDAAGANQSFAPLNTALIDPWAAAAKSYMLASNMRVYECVVAGAGVATQEPVGVGTSAEIDGYTWRFLYDLSAYDEANLLTTSWLPVNWGEKESIQQGLTGDTDANHTLNAKYVMVRARLLDTDLPVNTTYRKLGLISNPVLVDGVTPATGDNYLSAALSANSGFLTYEERRPPITRNTGQFEEIKVTIEF